MDPIIQQSLIILGLPLLSYVLTFFFGEKLPRRGDFVGVGILAVCWLMALRIFFHFWGLDDPSHAYRWSATWFSIDRLQVDFGVLVDGMTAVMLVVVTTVSFLVHLFSVGYMAGDGRYSRYFAFLGWFTFSMLGIVLADNLFFLYVFWELVGLASYLLIGFFFHKHSAANANKKAFLTNRVGDFGFWLGILIFFTTVGTFDYHELFAAVQAGTISGGLLTAAGVLLFMGCVGKSAQVPLHIWLPDAMEGPTPVSALIHAATMVAAGVYMIARLFLLFTPDALLVILWVGAITALLAATIAVVMNDIKKSLAYSTISQLGYMVMAVGAGGVMSGMFHLTTHAFFKALLFLGSGAVIHAMHHEQDMRAMGGLRRKMPITFVCFTLATVAIAGVPPLAGFFSKDAILGSALAFGMTHPWQWVPFAMALLAAGFTAFYMFRIVFLTFTGEPRDQEKHDHAHEVGFSMAAPLVILAFLAVIAGGITPAGSKWFERFVVDPGPEHAVVVAASGLAHGEAGHAELAAEPEAAHDEHAAGLAPDHAEPLAPGHDPAAPVGHEEAHDVHHTAHLWAMYSSLLVAGLGILLSWLTYQRKVIDPARVRASVAGWQRWLENKYYFDEFYQATVYRATLLGADLIAAVDKYVVDGVVNGTAWVIRAGGWFIGAFDNYVVDGLVNGTGQLMRSFGSALRTLQTGRVQSYLLGLISGLVILVLIYRAAWPS